MRVVGRAAVAASIVALVASACVAAPGASLDPSGSPDASAAPTAAVSASPIASAVPSAAPASAPPCPTPLPLDPATGAMVTTVAALVVLGDAAAACYGDAKLQVTAYVPAGAQGGDGTEYVETPAWLYPAGLGSAPFVSSSRGGDERWLTVHVPPSIGSCTAMQGTPDCAMFDPYLRRWIQVVGHFNDSASATCAATPRTDIDTTAPAITPAESEATCRTRFVLDSFAQLHATGDMPAVDPGLCPVEPIGLDQLVEGAAAIGPWYGASCLGDRDLMFDAYVVPGVGLLSGMEQDTLVPRWLADPFNTGVVLADTQAGAADATRWFVARVPPDTYPDVWIYRCDGSAVDPSICPFADYVGQYVRVIGHFDDYESMACRIADPAGEAPSTTPEAVILGCREQFVIDTFQAASGPEPSPTPPTTSTGSHR